MPMCSQADPDIVNLPVLLDSTRRLFLTSAKTTLGAKTLILAAMSAALFKPTVKDILPNPVTVPVISSPVSTVSKSLFLSKYNSVLPAGIVIVDLVLITAGQLARQSSLPTGTQVLVFLNHSASGAL